MITVTDRAVAFTRDGEQLVGVLHVPDATSDIAVVVVVGGPQYRAGSHRQFVLLARALASAGYPVLRFDVRGMGDSSGIPRGFERINDDIAAAIDTLHAQLPATRHVVLWGLCDGASAALLYCDATHDSRVRGVCVLNPWVRSDLSLARTQLKHYYTRRLITPQFWARLFSGKVARSAVAELLGKLRAAIQPGDPSSAASATSSASYQQRMARAWEHLDGQVLLVLSGNDYTAKEFLEHACTNAPWSELLRHPGLSRHELPEADHTFSDSESRVAVEQLTLDWLRLRRFDMKESA